MIKLSPERRQKLMSIEQPHRDQVFRALDVIQPEKYVCYRTCGPIAIDGHLDEPSWQKAPWTRIFGHIEDPEGVPYLATRVKMLWDDQYFYVGAEIEDHDVWGTFTKRDSPICAQDTDFEVFIDPDDDGLNYMEFEINALNCVWDLLMDRSPWWGQGGHGDTSWDYKGVLSAVQVHGTLNAPWIVDQGWTVEIAFDFESMKPQCIGVACPPRSGDQWRVNMSRVDQDRERTYGFDWTWSCVGVYSMHIPELYGYVQFSDKPVGTGEEPFVDK